MSGWDGWEAAMAHDDYYANPAAADAELRAYEADEAKTFPPGCDHEHWELGHDEHQANCLDNPHAARRLSKREGQWDSQGVSEFGS